MGMRTMSNSMPYELTFSRYAARRSVVQSHQLYGG